MVGTYSGQEKLMQALQFALDWWPLLKVFCISISLQPHFSVYGVMLCTLICLDFNDASSVFCFATHFGFWKPKSYIIKLIIHSYVLVFRICKFFCSSHFHYQVLWKSVASSCDPIIICSTLDSTFTIDLSYAARAFIFSVVETFSAPTCSNNSMTGRFSSLCECFIHPRAFPLLPMALLFWMVLSTFEGDGYT